MHALPTVLLLLIPTYLLFTWFRRKDGPAAADSANSNLKTFSSPPKQIVKRMSSPSPRPPNADPNVDNGAFSSMKTNEIMSWLDAIGHFHEIDPHMRAEQRPKEQHAIASSNLRLALWDMQRFDYLFPGKEFCKTPNFKIASLNSWQNWKEPHPEIRAGGMGMQKFDGYRDAARLKSYVMTPFHMMAFTQLETAQGKPVNPPAGPTGNWNGVKKIMCNATLDLTGEEGRDSPFVNYFDKSSGTMLVMEFLDVKRVSWPEPTPKAIPQATSRSSGTQIRARPGAPLVPMMETPEVPLVVIRYSYTEGVPEGGSEFMLHLESRLREILPQDISDADLRAQLEYHLSTGEEMPAEHIRMLARLLSYNSELVDKEWADDQQSHWNISQQVQKETKISFFVPCLRPRFRAVEEIETGKAPTPYAKCGECGKATDKHICGSCRAVCYCDAECAKAHWPRHKSVCKMSKKLNDASSLPPNKLYIPTRAYIHWVTDFGFADSQEAVKMGGPPKDEPPRNEYGTERFVCRALLIGTMAFVYDRRRTVLVRFGPQEPAKAMMQGVALPFHDNGYRQFVQLMREKGLQGQLLYVWVRRVGDCVEVDLKDIPNQREHQWE
ncbi:hypothetical protein FB45DRAFT_1062907 [Roridomyces roridus]|uniref:MYND-type domain-containing protein n=1 Tax=Roridomyces roridus TaxID=1738132 RepID=A0AAD7BFM2_9AGAR|nr:hypothetical protein FB45DRAFT_1062907 [Roridomyces roridus]